MTATIVQLERRSAFPDTLYGRAVVVPDSFMIRLSGFHIAKKPLNLVEASFVGTVLEGVFYGNL